MRRTTSAVVQPFLLALYRGEADPMPQGRRLTFRVPRPVRRVLPLRTINLVQVADGLLTLILYNITLGWLEQVRAEASMMARDGLPLPLSEGYPMLAAIGVALPVALRHRWPLAAWRVAFAAVPLSVWIELTRAPDLAPYPDSMVIGYPLVLYSVAVRCERRITVGVWVLTFLAAWIIHPNSMPLVVVFTTIALLFGYNVRVRRSATAKLVEEERRTRQAESAQAVLEERARIARELHDVVAHHMSVIAIQAEAVPLKAAGDPAQLEAGLAEIRTLSLEAIAQLRQVLGVLRDPTGQADTAPQPGLDRIDELAANARAAGLAVLVKRSGELSGLPSAVELSAYRIVQESLSNVMRHAPGAAVAVDIARVGGELHLTIVNGPSPALPQGSDRDPSGTALTSGRPTGELGSGYGGQGAIGRPGKAGEPGPDVQPAQDRGRRRGGAPGDDALEGRASWDGATDDSGTQDGARSSAAARDSAESGGATRKGATGGGAAPDGATGSGAVRDSTASGGATRKGATGGGTARDGARGSGHGLIGMRERVALLDGTLQAGPVPGGGFEVRATLPIAGREST
ncbi:histidine kinase [Nonomuraea sp. NPDC049309]|uniref:histidine kinase n=1 Tax=Nonomuraea sp. NPDC049309 TaxID=3364350 RepID=UPI0037207FD7